MEQNNKLIGQLNDLIELKQNLFEILKVNKFDNIMELNQEIAKHDHHLAKTLNLLAGDYNTQLNIQQNHFIDILDKIISIEEKRLLIEIENSKHMDHEVGTIKVVESNNKNDVEKTEKIKIQLSDNTVKLLTEFKLIIYIVIIFILATINVDLLKSAVGFLKSVLIPI